MHALDAHFKQNTALNCRRNNFRHLDLCRGAIDFSSNDYLGFASDGDLIHSAIDHWIRNAPSQIGSGGSRVSSGNSAFALDLEREIARYHQAAAALIFGSGYHANVGLLSSVMGPNDLCFHDTRIHMSARHGIRLSGAQPIAWQHNDPEDLYKRLSAAHPHSRRFVMAESVYSCDGSLAPLAQIADLCDRYSAHLIIDEAHAVGILGPNGAGLGMAILHHPCLLARVFTFGKCLGTYGAAVAGSADLKTFLVNNSTPFIYTTMLPYPILASICAAYQLLPAVEPRRQKLNSLIGYFNHEAKRRYLSCIDSSTPIQAVLTPKGQSARLLSETLIQMGFDVRPMTYPSVPRESARLRICLHAFNTQTEIDMLLTALGSTL